jgi:hypothetical protein
MFLNIIPDKEQKKERIINTTNYIDNLLTNQITNKEKGYIILCIHYIIIIAEAIYIICFKPSMINNVIICIILLINLAIFLYYGGNGCILVRLERYFFDNKDWFGPITIIYQLLNIPITEKTQYYSELFFNSLWIIAIMWILLRGFPLNPII